MRPRRAAVTVTQHREKSWRAWWAAQLRRWRGEVGEPGDAAKPFVKRGWRYLTLHFADGVAQSRMVWWRPNHLLVGYTRTMMAALLWQPAPASIGMVGLGGGSQVKFIRRHLPDARLEVIEIDPRVIALRGRFGLPDDDDRLRVIEADAARLLGQRVGVYDLLLVDGYDATGIPKALSTQRFQDQCRDALSAGGVLATNLFGPGTQRHIARLRQSFGERMLVVDQPGMNNRVVFAWRGDGPPDQRLQTDWPHCRFPGGWFGRGGDGLAAEIARVADAFRAEHR
jgi:spermidine synthase